MQLQPGETLTKLSSTVERKAGHRVVSAGGADVEYILALVGRAILSKELDSLGTMLAVVGRCDVDKVYLQRYLYRSPKQNLDLFARFIEWETLSLSEQTIPSIVDDDIETAKVLFGRRERSFDLLVVHNVKLLDEQLLGGVLVLQVRKYFRFAESRDDPFAIGEDSFDEALAETG